MIVTRHGAFVNIKLDSGVEVEIHEDGTVDMYDTDHIFVDSVHIDKLQTIVDIYHGWVTTTNGKEGE